MKSWKFYCIICLVAIFIIVNGCKPTNKAEKGPDLPSQESMIMNFDFANSQKSAYKADTTLPYHTRAVLAVQYWSNVAGDLTNVPAAAYKAALSQQPYRIDSIWYWDYELVVGANNYLAHLKGQIKDDSVQWKMYISKVDAASLNNFLWFEGKSYVGRTGGWWIIYNPMSVNGIIVSEAGLRVDWKINSDKDKWLQYTYVADKVWGTSSYIDNTNKGGYIRYGFQEDPKYNAFYQIYSNTDFDLWEILWNTSNSTGQINLNSSIMGCWDANFADKNSCD